MEKQIKFKGYLRSYRRKLKKLAGLTDQEYHLYDALLHIVDWDKNHKDNFGITKESLLDIHRHYLPFSSKSKLSGNVNSLIEKGYIKRRPDKSIEVINFYKLVNNDVQQAERFYGDDDIDVFPNERGVPENKQGVSPNEQGVQTTEQQGKSQINDDVSKIQENEAKNGQTVQPIEQQNTPKETLNKLKQQQISDDDLIKRLVDRYGEDIKVPLRSWSPGQVWDAARITEARLSGGENIRNRVGCITDLCKEGAHWEGSEWQIRELRKKAREAEERRKWEEMNRQPTPEERARNLAALDKLRKDFLSGKLFKKNNEEGSDVSK